MSSAPILKLWAFSLHPSIPLPSTSTSTPPPPPSFPSLLHELLTFLRARTPQPPYKSSHTFYRSTVDERDFVMVSAYPSLEENLAADAEYVASGLLGRMSGFVEHRGLWMVEGEREVVEVLGGFQGSGVEVEVSIAGDGDGVGDGDGIRGVEVRGNREVVGEVWVKVTRVEQGGGVPVGVVVESARPTQGGAEEGVRRWRLEKFM